MSWEVMRHRSKDPKEVYDIDMDDFWMVPIIYFMESDKLLDAPKVSE